MPFCVFGRVGIVLRKDKEPSSVFTWIWYTAVVVFIVRWENREVLDRILLEFDYDNVVEDPAVIARIFDDVGNIDYIYQTIQECVDEVTEEQFMLYQQELDESPLVQW